MMDSSVCRCLCLALLGASVVLPQVAGPIDGRLSTVGDLPSNAANDQATDKQNANKQEVLLSVDRATLLRRGPIALAVNDAGDHLFVANRKSGTVSVVSIDDHRIQEFQVGQELTDLVHWKENLFLCSDFARGTLLCVEWVSGELRLAWERSTIQYPCRLLPSDDGQTCWVGGLWSRQVSRVSLGENTSVDNTSNNGGNTSNNGGAPAVLNLPFAVGSLTTLDSGVLLALDAFGDQFATVDSECSTVLAAGELGSRRTGGVSRVPNSSQLLMSQQLLNKLAHSVRNDVHWGLMIANDLRLVDQARFSSEPFRGLSDLPSIPLGGAGDAKGDPGAIVVSATGKFIVALGGVNQIAIGEIEQPGLIYLNVGARPLSIAITSDGASAYVANHLDDTISAVDVKNSAVTHTISLGEQPEQTLTDLGERLFFDASLSHDRWMSCHSCHVEGHTSGFLNDNFSDQSFGAPKRILSLLGRARTEPFAWNGSSTTLQEQIRNSIKTTMQSDRTPTGEQIASLLAFLNGLQAPPSLIAARHSSNPEAIASGKSLFQQLNCVSCHQSDLYTSTELYEVGLSDELGNVRFNPPSLVGVSQRNRLFHDGRAKSLVEVLVEHQHQLDRSLTDEEMQDLIGFLQSL